MHSPGLSSLRIFYLSTTQHKLHTYNACPFHLHTHAHKQLAVVALAEKGVAGEAYNVGSGQAYSMQHLVDLLLQETKVNVTTRLDKGRLRAYGR